MPFNQEDFDTWIYDLRTTDAKQGKDYLRDDDKYCCLGRAVERLDPDGWQKNTLFLSGYSYHNCNQLLASELCVRLGLDSEIEITYVDGDEKLYSRTVSLQRYLTSLNDSGYSFKFIANVAASMIERFKREGKLG